eukprot:4478461-Ditylum_brightwellii.AAC.1
MASLSTEMTHMANSSGLGSGDGNSPNEISCLQLLHKRDNFCDKVDANSSSISAISKENRGYLSDLEHAASVLLLLKAHILNAEEYQQIINEDSVLTTSVFKLTTDGMHPSKRRKGLWHNYQRASQVFSNTRVPQCTEIRSDSSPYHRIPTRLALPEDSDRLNSLHCFIRSELLEIFQDSDDDFWPKRSIIKKNQGEKDENSNPQEAIAYQQNVGNRRSGVRVGLRCVYCANAPLSDREVMSIFYPKSTSHIYRKVCEWQWRHFRNCGYVPLSVKEKFTRLKEEDKTRGWTKYWDNSAKKLGLIDLDSYGSGKGLCFSISFFEDCRTI